MKKYLTPDVDMLVLAKDEIMLDVLGSREVSSLPGEDDIHNPSDNGVGGLSIGGI